MTCETCGREMWRPDGVNYYQPERCSASQGAECWRARAERFQCERAMLGDQLEMAEVRAERLQSERDAAVALLHRWLGSGDSETLWEDTKALIASGEAKGTK